VVDSLPLATLQQRGVSTGHGVPAAERGGRCPLRLAGVAGGHRGGDAHRRADRVEQLRQLLALLVVEPAVADTAGEPSYLGVCGDAAMIRQGVLDLLAGLGIKAPDWC
jgi:hypothetical protein